jgi:hypothetical protein
MVNCETNSDLSLFDIKFISIDEQKYLLEIFYKNDIYETIINTSNFSSNLIEMNMLENILNEDCDIENLDININYDFKNDECTNNEYNNKKFLNINIFLTYHQKPLKPIKEEIKIMLEKKKTDSSNIINYVLENSEKKQNRYIVNENSENIIIKINHYWSYSHTNEEKFSLIICGNENKDFNVLLTTENNFIKFLSKNNDDIMKIFENHAYNINEKNNYINNWILGKWKTDKAYLITQLFEFLSEKYYINFVDICGYMIDSNNKKLFFMINIEPNKKTNKRKLFYVINEFPKGKKYEIIWKSLVKDSNSSSITLEALIEYL